MKDREQRNKERELKMAFTEALVEKLNASELDTSAKMSAMMSAVVSVLKVTGSNMGILNSNVFAADMLNQSTRFVLGDMMFCEQLKLRTNDDLEKNTCGDPVE